MSLKKRRTFDDLVQENRQIILRDKLLMEKIEQQIEQKQKRIRQKKVQ
ncbi:FbpB family small basic protein [Virgibacillus proomii]|nr:FbpB family small basic protein [Virgibacillus proomii]MBU5266372.1 FbpB family small basic protein [Virgibacillus proomii]